LKKKSYLTTYLQARYGRKVMAMVADDALIETLVLSNSQ